MRIQEIVEVMATQESVDAINLEESKTYTRDEIVTILNEYLQSNTLQGQLAVGLKHKQQVFSLLATMYNLCKSSPNAVETNKIYAAMMSILGVFLAPYDTLTSDDTEPTVKDFTLIETVLGL